MIALRPKLVRPGVWTGKAGPDDVEAIAALLAAAAPDCVAMTPDTILARLGEFEVARSPSGKVIGSAAVRPLDARRAELRGVVVDPAWRAAGLGRLLVERAIDRASLFGLQLACVSRSPAFFESLGFERLPVNDLPRKEGVAPDDGRPRVALAHVPSRPLALVEGAA